MKTYIKIKDGNQKDNIYEHVRHRHTLQMGTYRVIPGIVLRVR